MAKIFDVKALDLIRLRKFYKKAPRQFNKASANVLNSFAFGTRKESLKVIHNKMNVRNQQFVVSSVRVDTAKGNQPINSQQSVTGSIGRARFTGWAEQELGKKTERTRIATKLARGGAETGQIKPGFRMKPGKNHPDPGEYKGKTNELRVNTMLSDLKRKKWKKPFVIKGHRKFKPGLYKFLRKKIRRLQEFKSPKAQPKRIRWMTMARDNYFTKNKPRDVWAESIRRVLRFK